MMDEDYDEDYNEDYYEDDMAQVHPETLHPIMLDVIRASTGINFTLLMEEHVGIRHGTERTDVTIHPRWNQPCYGELRKYKSTHPYECTQPKNEKPDDLWHPFPDGTPVAVGTKFLHKPSEASDALLRFVFSGRSPWLSGIGDPDLVLDKKEHVVGVLMRDTRLDPTVLVNLFNNTKSLLLLNDNPATFMKLIEGGFSEAEAIATILATRTPLQYVAQPDGYYTTQRLSLRRIVEQEARDLTGGTLHDRFDYNRTELENVFMLDGKPKMTFKEQLRDKFMLLGHWKQDVSETDRVKYLYDAMKQIIESEPPQSKTRFDVTTGKCILETEMVNGKEAA